MTIYDIFFLLGGLGLFLYGMSLMSEGLSLVAGSKLKNILRRLTRNKWLGAFFGFIITAIIQSSTATTVMVLGFIDSSLMSLSQAAGVIMGANAGTTLTGILFTFNIQDIVPFVIFLGTITTLFVKRKTFNHMGLILLGFGLLFLGLNLMSSSMVPLRESAFMADLFVHTQMPLIGLVVGFIVTALIQSSTASVGILLTMVAAGVVVDLQQAIFILYGFNVGTVVTTLVASIRGNKTAQQAAMVHVLFNVVGALIFTVFTVLPLGFVSFIQSTSENIALQLVYAHIVFNVATLFILLPVSKYIIQLSEKIIKADSEESPQLKLKFIDRRLIYSPEIEVEHILKEIQRTFELVHEDFKEATNYKTIGKKRQEVYLLSNEALIEYLVKEINRTLTNVNTVKLKEEFAITVGICYKVINYLRQIEEQAKDIALSLQRYEQPETIDDSGREEGELAIHLVMEAIVPLVDRMLLQIYEFLKEKLYQEDKKLVQDIERLDQEILNLTQINRDLLRADFEDIRIFNSLRRISADAVSIAVTLEHKR
ncbi:MULTISPECIES: Na/Pi cotransporter family protein [Lactococcus]|uniref:Na/Pi cotransporter family protein n=1 Tax=Lactococcus TaxID=1357 RepID=UPI00230022F0